MGDEEANPTCPPLSGLSGFTHGTATVRDGLQRPIGQSCETPATCECEITELPLTPDLGGEEQLSDLGSEIGAGTGICGGEVTLISGI